MYRLYRCFFFIITLSILFVGCYISNTYQSANEELEKYFLKDIYDYSVNNINIKIDAMEKSFSKEYLLSIWLYKKENVDIKSILINDLKIESKRGEQLLVKNIYAIYIMDYTNNQTVQFKDLNNFYQNCNISCVTNFEACHIYANDLGIKYNEDKEIKIFLDLTIETESGLIEKIKREYRLKRRTDIYNIFEIIMNQ